MMIGWPHLEYAKYVWSPHAQYVHTKILENVQIWATKLVDGMSDMEYDRLKLPTLRYQRERGDMIEIYKHLNAYDKEVLSAIVQQRDRVTTPNNQKLTEWIVRNVCAPIKQLLQSNHLDLERAPIERRQLWVNRPIRVVLCHLSPHSIHISSLRV